MKRSFASFLAILFLLPSCGSVLARASTVDGGDSKSHHHSASVDHGSMAMPEPVSAFSNPMGNHPHITKGPALDCCASGHELLETSIPERMEKTVLKNRCVTTVSQDFQRSITDAPRFSCGNRSTAPPGPGSQEYQNLIGIVKRLN